MRKVIIAILFVFVCQLAFPQLNTNPSFRHIPVKNLGLKTAFGQTWDNDGNMWMVCEDGIFCYNGYSGKRFRHVENDSSTLLSSFVQGIYADKKNRLWIIYGNRPGITKMDLEDYHLKHFYPDTNSAASIPTELISGFKEDNQGNLWLLTWGGGIAKMNTETGACKTYKPNPDKPNDNHFPKGWRCKSMVELPDGRYLAGFWGFKGLNSLPAYFDPEKETFTEINLDGYFNGVDEFEKINIINSLKIIHFVYVDKKNNYWFGSYSGLMFMDNQNKTIRRISGNKIDSKLMNLDNANRYVVDDNGLIWIGTPNNAIMMVDPETLKAWYIKNDSKNSTSLSDNRIRTMKKDAFGNIWIATDAGVFNIYSPLLQNFNLYEWDGMDLEFSNRSAQVIPINQVNVDPKGHIFISNEHGLSIFDPKTKSIIEKYDMMKLGFRPGPNPGNPSRAGNFKILDSNRVFIIGTNDRGELNLKTKKVLLYNVIPPEEVAEKYKGKKNGYHPGGLLFRHTSEVKSLILTNQWAGDLFTTGEKNESTTIKKSMIFGDGNDIGSTFTGVLKDGKWIASANNNQRFVIIDWSNKSFTFYSHKDSIHHFPDSSFTNCYLDHNKNIWFGTPNGLYSFDPITGKSEYMNPKLGLDKEEINSIYQDEKGNFWIALQKEILKWDPSTNITFKFGREFGLTANSFVPCFGQADAAGNIYFLSVNGLLGFNPNKLNIQSTKNKVRLSFVSIKEDTLNLSRVKTFAKGQTTLNWNQNFINFEFASYAGFNIMPHHFYYRLIGLDTVWQDNDISNRIRFTNLAPDSYTLQVKLVNAYNEESELLAIPFIIKPPFWKTWWFYILSGGVILLAGYGYMRYRERAFRKKQEILEAKIAERTAEVVAKAKEIEQQKDIILEKNKELTDSIHYAQRIQKSILPQDKEMSNGLKEHFVYFKPKDIVSGDFYWYSEQKDSVLWAVVDCTGHGVPGGFMSMLGSGLLNQIVNEELKLEPNIVLDNLRDRVIIALKQTGEYGDSRDGMDLAFCRYIPKENKIQFAGANNSLYKVRNGELIELKPDKQPIGIYVGEQRPFKLCETDVQKGDCFYTSSDGYPDQFGGPKGKKFKSSNLEKLFLSISNQSIEEQAKVIDKTFQEWKGVYEQLDDVCVIGVKF